MWSYELGTTCISTYYLKFTCTFRICIYKISYCRVKLKQRCITIFNKTYHRHWRSAVRVGRWVWCNEITHVESRWVGGWAWFTWNKQILSLINCYTSSSSSSYYYYIVRFELHNNNIKYQIFDVLHLEIRYTYC